MNDNDSTPTAMTVHDAAAERSILGAIMRDPRALPGIREILKPNDLYRPQHAAIYDAMLALDTAGEPVDLVSVNAHMAAAHTLAGAGGLGYLAELSNAAPGDALYYTDIVVEHARKRAVATVGMQLSAGLLTTGGTAATAVAAAMTALETVNAGDTATERTTTMAEARATMLESAAAGGVPIIATGLTDLDEVLGRGLRPGQLTIIAARPSVGKTVLLAGIAAAAAGGQGKRGLFVSIEMDETTLQQRMMAARLRIDFGRMTCGDMPASEGGWSSEDAKKIMDEEVAWDKAGGMPSGGEILFMSTESHRLITIDLIVSEAKRLHRKQPLDFVMVDYLQLIKGDRTSKNDRPDMVISAIAWELKLLAKTLGVPVVVAAQLNRSAADSLPRIEHLKESDGPAATADTIILMHDPRHTGDEGRAGELDLIVVKNRNGANGVTIPVAAIMHQQRIANLAVTEATVRPFKDYGKPRVA